MTGEQPVNEPVDGYIVNVWTARGDPAQIDFHREPDHRIAITYCGITHGRISIQRLLRWLDDPTADVTRQGPLSLGWGAGAPWIGIHPEIRAAPITVLDVRHLLTLNPFPTTAF